MNDLGNTYALAALRERRAELAGELASLQKRLRQLRESMVHMDATIRLFDPEGDPTKIPGKRPADRPYAETRGTDPDGNNFDLSVQGYGVNEENVAGEKAPAAV